MKRICLNPLLFAPLDAREDDRARGKTKRRLRALVCTIGVLSLIFAVIIFVFCDTKLAFAQKDKSAAELEKQLGEAVDDAIDGLDADKLEEYLRSLGGYEREGIGIEDVKSALKALVRGEGDFFSRFLSLTGKSVGRYFAGFLPACVTMIIICLLNNMLGGLTSELSRGGTTEVVHMVCYGAIIIVLMSGVVGVIGTVTDTVYRLTTFAEAVFPLLLTLLSMLGGSSAVATFSPYMAALSSAIMQVITAVIVPAFIAAIVFSVVGNLSKNVKLDKLTKLIKSSSTWLMGIVFGLFTTFLTVQGVTGGVVDKFGFNMAKFALSSYVPVLGGYLSDGFDLFSASLALVKNALGYTGVVILVSSVLFPLLQVASFSLLIRLTAAIAEPIGDSRVASLLTAVASNMKLLIAALAGVAFEFFVLLMLLIGSCNMGI